jgi:hypothetical protein
VTPKKEEKEGSFEEERAMVETLPDQTAADLPRPFAIMIGLHITSSSFFLLESIESN